MGKRVSKSRPNQGIVDFRHEGINQDGVIVCICDRAALMHFKPDADQA
jgi:acyl dehydratase